MCPILTQRQLECFSGSAEQTRRFGERLGRLLQPGDVVCLEGELGTGKTCMVQGIGRGLGIADPIASPSFIMVSEYRIPESGLFFYHIDLYRLEDKAGVWTLGLEEYLYGQGVCAVEWAEKATSLMPRKRLWITLRHLGEFKRVLTFEARGKRYQTLLKRFREETFGG
ncbi:MAG: tRNA (adenosine(37)-N6)-threonylcarbamoyltransferase complex ATPase subunit type 1 TsaE [Chloroflexi bacterium]|nr:tRNA (adenosine(37)-N6)-threonylcarbamoyltransferase complex ATPase subunit type 1 TsaE [Chloroflexota bacterium]